MKVALCFPRFKYPTGDPPLGVCYLAACLERETNAEITVIDTTFAPNPIEYIESFLKRQKFDIFGLSFMTSMLSAALQTAEMVKSYSPDTLVIAGGPHSTVASEKTLHTPYIDAVTQGEGEGTIVELVRNGGNPEGVAGVWYKRDGQTIRNPERPVYPILDSVPFPAFQHLDMETYFKYWYQLDAVATNLRGTTIFSSRGCPYKCTFCQPTLNTIFGKKLRTRSPSNILDEIERNIADFGINAMAFQDDTFTVNRHWVEGVCDEFERRKVNILWGCNVRANLVPRDLLVRMREVGLRKINVGIESASPRILKEIYDKGVNHKQIANCVELANELGIKVLGFFMLGAPTETEEEINDTIRFARRLKLHDASFSITTPLMHTHLYEKSKHLIGLPLDRYDYYKTSVYHSPKVVDQRRLNYLKRKAFFTFYFHPQRLLSTLKLFITPRAARKTFLKMKRL